MPRGALAGKRVVLGVTGGIAAYKAVELLRLLTKSGADVEVVLTREAAEFVGPLTFTALSHKQARTELFGSDDPIPHTRLGQWADLVVVAPATAHTAARLANGLADDLLTNTLLATRAPVVVALAMHTEMWEQPAVQRNVARLRADGVVCVLPEQGELAGGDVGMGRMAAPDRILAACEEVFADGPPALPSGPRVHELPPRPPAPQSSLEGRRVLVTAGGTREPIDPVRYIGNRSSGKMGHAIASEAAERGASVVLVTTSQLPVAGDVEVVRVETAAEMADAVLGRYPHVDCVVMSAAVADFRPADAADEKIKKDGGPPRVVLVPTLDILAALGDAKSHQVLVGFAAETGNVPEHGSEKVAKKNLDLLVANLVGQPGTGFGSDTNRAYLCRPGGAVNDLGMLTKLELASLLCDEVAALFGQGTPRAGEK